MVTVKETKVRAAKLSQIIANKTASNMDIQEVVEYMTVSMIEADMFPGKYDGYNLMVMGPFMGTNSYRWEIGYDQEDAIKFFTENRQQIILWKATLHALQEVPLTERDYTATDNVVFSRRSTLDTQTELDKIKKMIKYVSEIKVSKGNLLAGIQLYKEDMETFERRAKNNILNNGNMINVTPFEKMLHSSPVNMTSDAKINLAQARKAIEALPENGLTARTWGFEIEVPDCKGIQPLANSGIEKGDDGSLRSYNGNENCECGCDDCDYHECDCDRCYSGNSDPEHCGNDDCSSAESAEYRTKGGVQRVKHFGMYDLCKRLNEADAEMNESAGTHIHVYAADLTTNQVGQVMAAYEYTRNIMAAIAGRYNVSYARFQQIEHIQRAMKRSNPQLTADKPRAINVTPLGMDRGTIEFRQMDCNLDAELITFWAWMLRGLVSAAKRGATVGHYKKVTDINGIIEVLAKFNHFLHDETPERIIYGSRMDQNNFTKTQHSFAANR